MLNGYHILTVSHHLTPLRLIGKFVVPISDDKDLPQRLSEAKAAMGIDELLYLATCNRVMVCFYQQAPLEQDFVKNLFERLGVRASPSLIAKHVQHFEGEAAVRHMLRVAASVESLVVGEREILRQLREAYEQCRQANLTGDNIRLLVQQAVRAAKEVYTRTRLGEKSVSVVSLAIRQMLKSRLPREARILMVGAGQTNALVCKFLKKYGFEHLTIYNRTLDKASQLAAQFANGRARRLSDLPAHADGFDCLIVCTASTTPIVDAELYQKLLAGETDSKLAIDLSVPNNIATNLPQQFDLQLIEVESLKQLARENFDFRQQEVKKAETLLDQHFEEFKSLYQTRCIERAFHRIPEEVKAVRERAVNEVFKKDLDKLDGPARQLVEQILGYMEKKCTGIPMRLAREAFVKQS